MDDPRNTDNAWMETVAVNFHDETGDIFGCIKLQVCFSFIFSGANFLLACIAVGGIFFDFLYLIFNIKCFFQA